MALSDILQLTVKQTYGDGGEECFNDFFYKRSGSSGNVVELIDHFKDVAGVIPAMNQVQADHIKNISIRGINLGDLTDFADVPLEGEGAQAADPLPIFAAYGFTLKLDTRAVKNGSKRFVGVVEAATTNGVVTDATTITNLGLLRTVLAFTFTGDVDTYLPVVVKRVLRPADLTHDNPYYTLPRTDGELVIGNVVTALMSLKVTHQTSRGNGR